MYCHVLLLAMLAATVRAQIRVEPGVSHALAEYRARHVSQVAYRLSFAIPEEREQPVANTTAITFCWDGEGDLQLDFQGQLTAGRVNGRKIRREWYRDEHIVIPAKLLRHGSNTVELQTLSQDKALNRQADYLYTLFVPDHARSVFPCFDQPDLKAVFSLTLDMPEGWTAITNSGEPIPTYLFSFTAGKFHEQTATRDGRELRALYRETDPAKVAQLPIIFDEIALALKWLETYTGIPYPFGQYGFAILPGYQFGGMEHPGCIQYRDQTLLLGPNPTPDEELNRLHLLAHETAHMWFGDLVTMRWFDDVWTKEVFANFMADKIAREQFPDINHDLSFLRTHYIPALATDRTLGTHPIQQPLDNLNQAGLLYGNIIYHKAPIMMRKLEQQMGEEAFRRGLQKYLRQFAFGNATWDDLIAILDGEAPQASIPDFDRQWVKQKGVPLKALDPRGETLPNADGMDYVRYELADRESAEVFARRIDGMPTAQCRLAAVMTLYENMLLHHILPRDLFRATKILASAEEDELLLAAYGNYLGAALSYMDGDERDSCERQLWQAAREHPVRPFRQQLLRSLARQAVSAEVTDSLHAVWTEGNDPLLNPRDFMQMACHLAVVRPDSWQQIVATQRSRLHNADVLKEFDFVSRACTPDTAEQKRLFGSLLRQENRAVEPYASAMLALLNDPTREPFSISFITPGLDILEEIQQTGDIFFPLSWCQALLGGHRSQEAARLVQDFLDSHPDYPGPLRNKLLQAAHTLLNRYHN